MNPHEEHVYVLAASLQLEHLHIKLLPHSGQLNLTHLSLGIMCLLHPLHIGNDIVDDDIPRFSANIIYTFLEI